VLDFLVSLLYPKKCVRCKKQGNYICDNCFTGISFLEHQFCAICQKGSIDGLTHPKCDGSRRIDGILSAVAYRGIVKKLIYQYKYKPYLSDLKKILGRILFEGLIQQESFAKFIEEDVLIASIPLHQDRERVRGYNQSDLLARELSARLGIKYVPQVLIRKRKTRPQFELKKEDRIKNILGAFEVNAKYKIAIKNRRIILVDDITTTGSTLRECGKILKKSGVIKVLGVTLSHEGE